MYKAKDIKKLYYKISKTGLLSEEDSMYLYSFAEALSNEDISVEKLTEINKYFRCHHLDSVATINSYLIKKGTLEYFLIDALVKIFKSMYAEESLLSEKRI